jgi:hypothetical protein
MPRIDARKVDTHTMILESLTCDACPKDPLTGHYKISCLNCGPITEMGEPTPKPLWEQHVTDAEARAQFVRCCTGHRLQSVMSGYIDDIVSEYDE